MSAYCLEPACAGSSAVYIPAGNPFNEFIDPPGYFL